MTLNLITCVLFFSAIYTLRSCAYAFRQYNYPVAHWCGWLMMAISLYSFGYGMELSSQSLPDLIFWITLEFCALGFIPGCLLLMTFSYQKNISPTWTTITFVLGLSSVIPILAITNPYHDWLFEVSRFNRSSGLSIADLHLGPAYAYNILFCNLASIISLAIFTKSFIESKPYRKQIGFIIAGNCVPWFLYLWNLGNFATLKIDLFPFGLVFTAFFYGHGIFHLRFANITPIAREQTFELFAEPILIINHRFELVDYNVRAKVVFPEISKKSVGLNLVESGFLSKKLFSTDMTCMNQMNDEYLIRGVMYEARLYPLRDVHQQMIGYSLILHAAQHSTESKQAQDESEYFDHLTHLLNRKGIYQHLFSVLTHQDVGSFVSIILFDVDNFRQFNLKFGFPVGDELLRNIAHQFQQQYSRQYVMGRFDGDEFMVVLEDTRALIARQVARDFSELIAREFQINMSYGLATSAPNDTAELLINRADLELYRNQSSNLGVSKELHRA